MTSPPSRRAVIGFALLSLAIDFAVGCYIVAIRPRETDLPVLLILGLLAGQFGLCCAARARFPSARYYALAGLVGLPLLAAGIWYPLLNESEVVIMLLLGALITMMALVSCLAPVGFYRWFFRSPRFQLSLQEMFILIGFFAVISLAASGSLLLPLMLIWSLVILLMHPAIITCLLLASNDRPGTFSAAMLIVLLLNALLLPLLYLFPPHMAFSKREVHEMAAIILSQLFYVWWGGLILLKPSDMPASAPSHGSMKVIP